ncbi:unnamed protein product [Brassicogethes aeneus]|uniref:THAP-type domain-containing protein n=1 Tax=Brassicogethes aeneus TaxID=1431903 RepID=A0A9P0AVX5_BRAAE|nr:unnamed protein product [Brassicogethes aeneus]
MGKKCAVIGCDDKDSHRHRFPNPKKSEDLFKKWIDLSGRLSFHSLNPELVYRSRRVCHRHFREEDRATNMYLKNGTIPMLHLPANPATFNIMGANNSDEDFPQPIKLIKEESTDLCNDMEVIVSEESLKIKEGDSCNQIDVEFAEQCVEYAIKYLKQCSKTNLVNRIMFLENLKKDLTTFE